MLIAVAVLLVLLIAIVVVFHSDIHTRFDLIEEKLYGSVHPEIVKAEGDAKEVFAEVKGVGSL